MFLFSYLLHFFVSLCRAEHVAIFILELIAWIAVLLFSMYFGESRFHLL